MLLSPGLEKPGDRSPAHSIEISSPGKDLGSGGPRILKKKIDPIHRFNTVLSIFLLFDTLWEPFWKLGTIFLEDPKAWSPNTELISPGMTSFYGIFLRARDVPLHTDQWRIRGGTMASPLSPRKGSIYLQGSLLGFGRAYFCNEIMKSI